MCGAVKRAGNDCRFVEFENLFGAVADQGALQSPVLEVAGNPDLVVPAGHGCDRHAEDAGRVRTVRPEHGTRVLWVGAREIFHQVAGAVVVRIRSGIGA